MRILWLVIEDLFKFVFGYNETVSPISIVVRANLTPIKLETDLSSQKKIVVPRQTTPAVIVLPEKVTKAEKKIEIPNQPTIMYVCDPGGGWSFKEPYEEFDTALSYFPYGTAVTVLSFKGRYARIWKLNDEGWILKDILTPNKELVWPVLVANLIYDNETKETKNIRLLLKDAFGAGRFSLPLQSGEYILYRLLIDNRQIEWPNIRPRLPGTWQKILKGRAGVHMSVFPKTDSIMEWIDENGLGYLAYIEAVSPDNRLLIRSVGIEEVGILTEKTLDEVTWHELRPVFIEVL